MSYPIITRPILIASYYNCTLTPNTAIAPDGTLTSDTYSSNGVSPNGLYQTTATTASTIYTATIYVKYISGRWFRFMGYDGNSNQYRVWFDLQNGIMGTAQSNGTATFYNASMLNIGNGWYRISVTGSITTGTTYTRLNAQIGDGNTTTAVGDAYIWGAQLEQGAFPTSYIPTTAASVTRAADDLNIPTGGWFNAAEGTVNELGSQWKEGSSFVKKGEKQKEEGQRLVDKGTKQISEGDALIKKGKLMMSESELLYNHRYPNGAVTQDGK